MATGVDPNSYSNAFANAVQLQRSGRAADQAERMRALDIERAQGLNALGKDPNATPEQYVRAGDVAAGNALAGMRHDDASMRAEALPIIGGFASRVRGIEDPAIRRAAFRQVVQTNAPLFELLGTPSEQALAKLDASDDAQLEQTLDSLARFAQTDGQKIGAFQPGDYTPESFAKFQQTGNAGDLVRFTTPRQEFSPSFQNVTRTLPDGSTQQGVFNTRTGEYQWQGAIIPAGTKARTDAQARAEGEAEGGQAAKAPALASFDYVVNRFRSHLPNTPQGGFMGLTGRAGKVTDYPSAVRFDNLREQLSTELRTIFRIPGEGTLSDREQAQYGVQLPARENPREVNEAILEDVIARARSRLQTPIEAGAQPGAGGRPQPAPNAPAQGAVARPGSDAEYEALPSGARYIAPDGSTRTKR